MQCRLYFIILFFIKLYRSSDEVEPSKLASFEDWPAPAPIASESRFHRRPAVYSAKVGKWLERRVAFVRRGESQQVPVGPLPPRSTSAPGNRGIMVMEDWRQTVEDIGRKSPVAKRLVMSLVHAQEKRASEHVDALRRDWARQVSFVKAASLGGDPTRYNWSHGIMNAAINRAYWYVIFMNVILLISIGFNLDYSRVPKYLDKPKHMVNLRFN